MHDGGGEADYEGLKEEGGGEGGAAEGTECAGEAAEEEAAEGEGDDGGEGFGPAVGFGGVVGGGTAKAEENGVTLFWERILVGGLLVGMVLVLGVVGGVRL